MSLGDLLKDVFHIYAPEQDVQLNLARSHVFPMSQIISESELWGGKSTSDILGGGEREQWLSTCSNIKQVPDAKFTSHSRAEVTALSAVAAY